MDRILSKRLLPGHLCYDVRRSKVMTSCFGAVCPILSEFSREVKRCMISCRDWVLGLCVDEWCLWGQLNNPKVR